MKLIVIDFGTSEVKLMRAVIDGQRIILEDFVTLPAKPDYFRGLGFPDNPAWAAVTIQLNELDWLKPDEDISVLSSLPSAYLETRYLRFPFKSEKKIEKVLGFELEGSIPFDLEEIQVRHHMLEGDGLNVPKKEALVLATSYKRDPIRQFETELRKFQLSIPSVTVQSLALSSLRQFLVEQPVYAFMQMGHSKTDFVILQKNGSILGVRTFWWGGQNLIQSLADEMKLDFAKAEEVLHAMTGESPMTEGMKATAENFGAELRQTLKSLQTSGLNFPKPLTVYTMGPTTRSPGLVETIYQSVKPDFEIRFRPFPIQNILSRQVLGIERFDDAEKALPALSMALTQMRAHRGKISSFSESNFQLQRNLRKLQTGSFTLLRNVGILLIAPFIYAVLQFFIQSGENKVILQKLNRMLESSGFSIPKDTSTDQIVKRMQKEIIENRQKIEQIQEDDDSPLIILSELSKSIPPAVKVDLKDFKVTPSLISLRMETPNDTNVDQLTRILREKYPNLKAGNAINCKEKKECRSFTVEIERSKT